MYQSTTVSVVDLRGQDPLETLAWLADIADNLRPEDLDEIAASSGQEPLVALIASVMDSEMGFIVFAGDEPISVFGAAPVTGMERDSGIVWMLGTPTMDRPGVARGILRLTRPYIDRLQARFGCLWNRIDARNDKSMRWLSWAGFQIVSVDPCFGREGRPFFTFARQEAPENV